MIIASPLQFDLLGIVHLSKGRRYNTYVSTTEFLAKVQLNFDLCSYKIDNKVSKQTQMGYNEVVEKMRLKFDK